VTTRPSMSKAPRLVLRIYVVMLLSITVVVTAIIFGKPRPQSPFGPGPALETLVKTVAQNRGDPPALRAELDRIKREHQLDITIYAAGGQLLGSSAAEPPRPASAEELQWASLMRPSPDGSPRPGYPAYQRPGFEPGNGSGPPRPGSFFGLGLRRGPPPGGPRLRAARVLIPLSTAGDHAIVHFESRGPPRQDFRFDILITLLTLGVASLVLARMIARPLRHIADAAHAFGAGDLSARSRVARRDELGELSATFNQMAERIMQLVRSQRELLASVSHELRTPLSRVRVALDLAAEGDPTSAHQSLRDITEDLEELEELVDDVLAMARLETSWVGVRAIPRVRTVEVSARSVVEKAVSRFSGSHAGRPLELDLDASDARITIEADPNLLRRVIENLLENAHKYSPEGSPLWLTLVAQDGQAVVTVADRGEGIGPEDLPFVFEPFFRADRSRTRQTGGVGLGLALSERIVEAHGGRIEIQSELGKGTRVTFSVPLAGSPADPGGHPS
jgi:two-component system, OmpR family, sensor kinase